MTDPLDRRLRTAGEGLHARAGDRLDGVAGVTRRAARQRRRSTARRMAAVAGVVVLVLAGGLVRRTGPNVEVGPGAPPPSSPVSVTSAGGALGGTSPGTTAGREPNGAVPTPGPTTTAGQRVTAAATPEPPTAPASTSTVPAAIRSCGQDDLDISDGGVTEAAGRSVHVLPLRNRGTAPCWLEGHLDVTFLDAGGGLIAQAQRSTALPSPHVILAPGERAHLHLEDRHEVTGTPACGAVVRSVTVRVYRPLAFDLGLPMVVNLCPNPVDQLRVADVQPGGQPNPGDGPL